MFYLEVYLCKYHKEYMKTLSKYNLDDIVVTCKKTCSSWFMKNQIIIFNDKAIVSAKDYTQHSTDNKETPF